MRIRRVVDLSVPVGSDTVVYPGDPRVLLEVHSTVARDGFNLLRVEMGSQSGTHVDAPYHVDGSTPRIDEVPLERFLGPAVVVDASRLGARARIDWGYVAPVADRMLDRGVRTFCIDAPSIDETPDEAHSGEGLTVHHLIAEAGGVIGENLRNLASVDWPDPFVLALPMRLEGADGAPVRAAAVEFERGPVGDPT